jgi:hypothetical protein
MNRNVALAHSQKEMPNPFRALAQNNKSKDIQTIPAIKN